jgi:hypothetical protein
VRVRGSCCVLSVIYKYMYMYKRVSQDLPLKTKKYTYECVCVNI